MKRPALALLVLLVASAATAQPAPTKIKEQGQLNTDKNNQCPSAYQGRPAFWMSPRKAQISAKAIITAKQCTEKLIRFEVIERIAKEGVAREKRVFSKLELALQDRQQALAAERRRVGHLEQAVDKLRKASRPNRAMWFALGVLGGVALTVGGGLTLWFATR